jgi:hypothetical protein
MTYKVQDRYTSSGLHIEVVIHIQQQNLLNNSDLLQESATYHSLNEQPNNDALMESLTKPSYEHCQTLS